MERALWEGRALKISIAATNPCHLWPLARELATARVLGVYYSGYPSWKLGGANGSEVRTHSLRTNIVYGLLKYVPATLRPDAKDLFRWQDHGFDRWVGTHLESCDFVHAMPGQALATFRTARQLRVKTVLNHATGPVRDWVRIMGPEYERVGLNLKEHCPYDEAYFAREDEEYALADFHCAASTVVRDQLVLRGVANERVWVVPYGADPAVFFPVQDAPAGFRILFAGQVCLRKGVRTLLAGVALRDRANWRVDFYGANTGECARDLVEYRGSAPLHLHGAVSQAQLADAMRMASVLVLPSLEEGFGLVVPQALNCGVPCLVSDRVGAKDLIRHRENGSIFPAEDPDALAGELAWWAAQPRRVTETFGWTDPARQLIALSDAAL
jgi:glycosyltransferase involved in cell wall biosynthesis